MTVPNELIGCIIGKGGSKVAEIRWGTTDMRIIGIFLYANAMPLSPEIIGMDIENRTCKYVALKRTCSKYVAGRVVNMLPHLSLPHSGKAIFCSFC